MKKVGIITINYNNIKGLQKTFDSVFSQQNIDFDYYVIDGGSTDGSKEIIEDFSDKITLWISEKDNGIYNAMNKGIQKATSEYLLFLNSGDFFTDNTALSKALAYLDEDLVYFNLKICENNGTSFIKKYPNKLTFSYFLKDTLPHPACFIKKSLFVNYGTYNESLKIVSDWEFFIHAVCKFQCSYKYVDKEITSFIADGISSKIENFKLIHQEREQVITKNYLSFMDDYNKLEKLTILNNHIQESRIIKLIKKIGLIKWL